MNISMRYLPLVILVLLTSSPFSIAQRCKSAVYLSKHRKETPHLESVRNEWRSRINALAKLNQNSKQNNVVTLPIVFHVIFNTNAQNIDSTQIASQIDVINADFRLQNSNSNILEGGFVNLASDTEIEFKLADIDPDGNPTNGITRTFTSNPAIGGSDNEYYDPARGGVPAWDPERYINIWVVNINAAGGDFGFATFPGEASPISSDGVVIDFKYLGTTGTAANSAPQHLGRTLTHELGHFFGLNHIWGDVDDCSMDDDISDTPLQETSTDGCRTFPAYDMCSSSGDGVNYFNYMDYTDDACMAMFTAGQVARMRAVLSTSYANGGRSELVELFSNTAQLELRALNLFPNPTSNSVTVVLDDASLIGQSLSIYDINGTLIHEQVIRSERQEIQLLQFVPGLYILKAQSGRVLWSQKIIKTP